MLRATALTVALGMAALEPVLPALPGDDYSLVKYAITQGGLVLVVIVLLWSYRRDFTRVLGEQQDRLAVMTELVQLSTTALTRSADASDRMARAVENMERRQ